MIFVGMIIACVIGIFVGYFLRYESYSEQRFRTFDFIDEYNKILKDKEIQQLKDTIIRLEKELTDKEQNEVELNDIIRSG